MMRPSGFEPCLPTRRTSVPAARDWIHETKHNGFRLIVQREGERVRLWTPNGHDRSGRFPLITEAALHNRQSSFVIRWRVLAAISYFFCSRVNSVLS
jgi:bifunctional non-homologous end joining protein LigD